MEQNGCCPNQDKNLLYQTIYTVSDRLHENNQISLNRGDALHMDKRSSLIAKTCGNLTANL